MTPRLATTTLLALLLVSTAAKPAAFEVTASGPFETVDPLGLLPFAAPPAGTILHLSFLFDDSVGVADTAPSRASYTEGISPLRISLGGETYRLADGAREIRVTNDCACVDPGITTGQPYEDSWSVAQTFIRPEEGLFEGMTLALVTTSFGSPGGPLTSTALAAPPGLGEWESAVIFFIISELDPALRPGGRLAQIRGRPTSLEVTPVPGPATFWLLGSGLAALGGIGRSAHQRPP